MKSVLTLRLDHDVKEKLDRLALIAARSKSYVAEEAIREYVENNVWQLQAIQDGIGQADAGKLISHEEIKTTWERKLENLLDKQSKSGS